jgi:hypothetical protein
MALVFEMSYYIFTAAASSCCTAARNTARAARHTHAVVCAPFRSRVDNAYNQVPSTA